MKIHARARAAGFKSIIITCSLALAPPLFAHLAPLDDALASIAKTQTAGDSFDPLESESQLLIAEARNASLLGNFTPAWDAIRRAQTIAGTPHPAIFREGAAIAERQGDTLRESVLLRRVLAFEPADDASRRRLALLLGQGVPSVESDAWILARTLQDKDAELDESDRIGILRVLTILMDTPGQRDIADLLKAEIEAAAEVSLLPELVNEAQEIKRTHDQELSLEKTVAGVEDDPLDLHRLVMQTLRTAPDAESIAKRAAELDRTPSGIAVHAYLMCEAGEAKRADGLLRSALLDTPGHPALIAARARSLYLLGDYALLRRLGEARAEDDASELELGALLLRAGAGYEQAGIRANAAVARTPTEDTARYVRRSMLSAQIAMDAGDFARASDTLVTTHRMQPLASEPLRELVQLHAPEGPSPNVALHTMASSRLLALEDDPHDASVLRATDALRRGYADIAEGIFLELAEARPEDPLPSQQLVRLWIETDRSQRALKWLKSWIERRPSLSHLRTLIADVYIGRERIRSATHGLEDWYDKNPGDMVVARHLEYVYRNHTTSTQLADDIALKRLRRLPNSLQGLKDRTLILSRLGDPDDIAREIDILLPLAQRMNADLGDWSVEIFRRLHLQAIRRRNGEADITPLIVRLHAGIPKTPYEADRLAIDSLGTAHSDPNAVLDATRRAMARHEEYASELAMTGAEALLIHAASVAQILADDANDQSLLESARQERVTASLDLAERAVVESMSVEQPSFDTAEGRTSALMLGRALRLVQSAGSNALKIGPNGRAIVDRLLNSEKQEPILIAKISPRAVEDEALRKRIGTTDIALDAHVLSGIFGILRSDDKARADACSELALRLDPDNPRINNDFGYRLAERGERLEDAEAMTAIAVAAEPQNYSHLDSLAWVKYKRGAFRDEGDERGAITLLRTALEIADDSNDAVFSAPVIGDHYADALWASGQHEQAIRVWTESVQLATKALASLSPQVGPQLERGMDRTAVHPSLHRYLDVAERIDAKIAAAQAGEVPPIAPPHGPGFSVSH